jgi:hypothetical protein
VHGRRPERLTIQDSIRLRSERNLPANVRLRILGTRDLEEVLRIHQAILNSLPRKDLMYRRERGFFDGLLRWSGRIIGAFSGGSLVGYIGLRFPTESRSPQARSLAFLGFDIGALVEGAGGGVLPSFRGRGLYSSLIQASDQLGARLGFSFRSAIVSPNNLPVARMLLTSGYYIASNIEDLDGDNYVMLKHLRPRLMLRNSPALKAHIGDSERNFHLLRQGFCGFPSSRLSCENLRFRRVRITN